MPDRTHTYIYLSMLDRYHRITGLSQLPFSIEEFITKYDLALSKGICEYCLQPLTLQNASPDHATPLCRGGSWDISNIKIVCSPCNMAKHYMCESKYKKTLQDILSGVTPITPTMSRVSSIYIKYSRKI